MSEPERANSLAEKTFGGWLKDWRWRQYQVDYLDLPVSRLVFCWRLGSFEYKSMHKKMWSRYLVGYRQCLFVSLHAGPREFILGCCLLGKTRNQVERESLLIYSFFQRFRRSIKTISDELDPVYRCQATVHGYGASRIPFSSLLSPLVDSEADDGRSSPNSPRDRPFPILPLRSRDPGLDSIQRISEDSEFKRP